jgi:hypothetical protein
MNLTLQEMINAFERTSLDEHLYMIMRSDEELDVCIEFNRNDQFRCWSFYFRDASEESKQRCSKTHAVEVARAFKLNDTAFSNELARHLLTQAAFADQFVREVQELLGVEAVRESIMGTQLFMDALKEAVSSALETESHEADSADEAEETPEPLPPPSNQTFKLRVIKGS